jgi:hypothetical protein
MHVQQMQHFPRQPAVFDVSVCVDVMKKPPDVLSDNARQA